MGATGNFEGSTESPYMIQGLEFFTESEASTRPGNLFSEKLHHDYHNDPKTGYHIPFVPIGDPWNRRLKIITIGAGFGGVMLAYNIEKHCENVDLVMYEKNPTVGGTWFNFALATDWEKYHSGSDWLGEYIHRVVKKLDLEKYMIFNSKVVEARFDETKGIWAVKVEQTASDGSKKMITDDCDLLLGAVGVLDRWEYPKIPGLETFKGRVIHTADRPQWEEYTQDHWANEEVAVIGSGANTEEEKALFKKDHSAMIDHAKANEGVLMMMQHMMVKHNPAYFQARKMLIDRTREWIKDDALFEKFIPTWSPGCRRITPGDPFMLAIQKPNVEVHFTGVSRVDEKGVFGDDGTYTACDTIVCATGFDVSYRPPFPLLGLDGYDLRKGWETVPAGYIGIMAPKIPNYLMIKKMQRDNIRYFVPRQEVVDEFNDHAQSWFKGTVWEENCNAWYKNRKTGRVDAIWPGSCLHYRDAIEDPRWEDMEIKYHSKNRFQYLGYGFAPVDLSTEPNADRSPYLQVENLDPRFYA
ncbi:hypothetical protein IL306_003765 [Fusarium sp. DS 682]|nr:hypothetical protein IL306_003765 [Fusarium sp. DS 682]